MSAYWRARRQEILTIKDDAFAYDLASDMREGISLTQTSALLFDIAARTWFVGEHHGALELAQKAAEYCQEALAQAGPNPQDSPAMAAVFQRLFYARWWFGEERPELVTLAATARSSRQEGFAADLWDIYLRAALLWLEAGDRSQAATWADHCLRALACLGVDAYEGTSLESVMPVIRWCVVHCHSRDLDHILALALEQASLWESPQSSLSLAIELASIQHRLLGKHPTFAALLESIQ